MGFLFCFFSEIPTNSKHLLKNYRFIFLAVQIICVHCRKYKEETKIMHKLISKDNQFFLSLSLDVYFLQAIQAILMLTKVWEPLSYGINNLQNILWETICKIAFLMSIYISWKEDANCWLPLFPQG